MLKAKTELFCFCLLKEKMKNVIIKYVKRFVLIFLPVIGFCLANFFTSLHLKTFCLIKLITHHNCWGCGLTRAFAALSHFNFAQAYNDNPRIIIVAPLLFYVWFVWLKNEFYPKKIGNKKGTVFCFNDTATTESYTLSLLGALPIFVN